MSADEQEKIHQPSGRKLSRARQEGNVTHSQDLGSALILLAGLVALRFLAPDMSARIQWAFRAILNLAPSIELTADSLPGYFVSGGFFMLRLLAPFALIVAAVGLLVNLAQVGPLFTTKPLQPKFDRVDPVKGLKRIFSLRGLMEAAKGVAKVFIVGAIGYFSLKAELPALSRLMDYDVAQIISIMGGAMFRLGLKLALALLVIGILDWKFQTWKRTEDLKMSHKELKDEHRQTEGDPQVKVKIRRLQLKTSLNRMIKEMPRADVVVANPVHIAVALRYDSSSMKAPKVVAKGKRLLAERIKTIAREHNIPIVEDPPLARSLYKSVEVGWEIPYELFQAVAEVLAMVYRLKKAA